MQTSVKFWTVISIGLVLAMPLRAEVLYVANPDGDTISAFKIEATGALKAVPGSPYASLEADSMAVDIPGRFLYTASTDDGTVSVFRIDSNGALTHLSDLKGVSVPSSLTVDPFGRFLYVTNHDGVGIPEFGGSIGHISVYRIGAGGALTLIHGSPFPAGFYPNSVVADPSGRFVYVGNDGGEEIKNETVSGYRVELNGVLNQLSGSPYPEGGSPEHLAIDPFSHCLYATNFYEPVLNAYRIGANGILNPVVEPAISGSDPSFAIDPSGRFLYMNPALVGFRVAANGSVTKLPPSNIVPIENYGFVFDLTGQFLYVASSAAVSTYHVLGNGELVAGIWGRSAANPGAPLALSFRPGSMVVSP
jgi:6-phosphogluconolactonase